MFTVALSLLVVGVVLSVPTVRREPLVAFGSATEPDAQTRVDGAVLGDLSLEPVAGERAGKRWGTRRRTRRTARRRTWRTTSRTTATSTTTPPPVNLKFGGTSHVNDKKDWVGPHTEQKKHVYYDGRRLQTKIITINKDGEHGDAYSLRPEVVKSEACDQKACHDCQAKEACWHGVDDESPAIPAVQQVTKRQKSGWRWKTVIVTPGKPAVASKAHYGSLALTLPAGSDTKYTSYIAEVYASCPSKGGNQKWTLDTKALTNGKMYIYTDTSGKLKRLVGDDGKDVAVVNHYGKIGWVKETKVCTTTRRCRWCRAVNSCRIDKTFLTGPYDLAVSGEKETRIRVAFYPADLSKEAKASILLAAAAVDANVDHCMIVKDCLQMLGDGSEESFDLRNVNDYQLDCLEGVKMKGKLQAKCVQWNRCMDKTEKKRPLKAFLRAALQKRRDNTGLAATASNVTPSFSIPADPNTCVDPFVDDAESYDCECLGEMVKRCESANSLEECLRTNMCNLKVVCSNWKEVNCPGYTAELDQKTSRTASSASSAMEARRQVNIKSDAAESLDSGIDDALQGKCSQ